MMHNKKPHRPFFMNFKLKTTLKASSVDNPDDFDCQFVPARVLEKKGQKVVSSHARAKNPHYYTVLIQKCNFWLVPIAFSYLSVATLGMLSQAWSGASHLAISNLSELFQFVFSRLWTLPTYSYNWVILGSLPALLFANCLPYKKVANFKAQALLVPVMCLLVVSVVCIYVDSQMNLRVMHITSILQACVGNSIWAIIAALVAWSMNFQLRRRLYESENNKISIASSQKIETLIEHNIDSKNRGLSKEESL